MHYSKTYSQILLTLPPELRGIAIEYRQLKKIINQVAVELSSLGLNPEVVQEHLDCRSNIFLPEEEVVDQVLYPAITHLPLFADRSQLFTLVYQLSGTSGGIAPRLVIRTPSRLQSQQLTGTIGPQETGTIQAGAALVIPLSFDRAFFKLLFDAERTLSVSLLTLQSDFIANLKSLSREISLTAGPVSSSSRFRPYSKLSTQTSDVCVPSAVQICGKSDLYPWREIFKIYAEAEVFESVAEASRGERTIEDSEARLNLFVRQVYQRGLCKQSKLHLKRSQLALETFLQLNMFILNVKKLQFANNEATRKILKKHAKRTALPLPVGSFSDPTLVSTEVASLPRIFVQAIGEILLPLIPHIDDYECLICTSIAFKPVRLFCGHLFCGRCLVKMQKRGDGNCPMCRLPTVSTADLSNVDWALLNFMRDWFPMESKEKLKENEREIALVEMGRLTASTMGCHVM